MASAAIPLNLTAANFSAWYRRRELDLQAGGDGRNGGVRLYIIDTIEWQNYSWYVIAPEKIQFRRSRKCACRGDIEPDPRGG